MQPDVITLAVDEDNDDGSVTAAVDHVYTRFEEYQNRSKYIHSGHLIDAQDTLAFYRTAPKSSGNFKGVAKTSVKFTKDQTVKGVDGVSDLTAPIIVEVGFSLPVGVTAEEVLLARQRVIAALDDDTMMDALNLQLMI